MNAITLAINIGNKNTPDWQIAYLEDDTSIDIEECSPLWNDESSYSYEFDLPFEPNRHLFGNVDHIFGKSIYEALYKKQFRLYVGGDITPFRTGTIDLDSEVELDGGNVSISLISGNKTFDDMLDGVNAQDVEIYFGDLTEGFRSDGSKIVREDENDNPTIYKDEVDNKTYIEEKYKGKAQNIQIGVVNANKTTVDLWVQTKESKGGKERSDAFNYYTYRGSWFKEDKTLHHIPLPQILWPYKNSDGSTDQPLFNQSKGYDLTDRYAHPYCNITICGQKYYKDDDNWEKERGYVTFGPGRLNTSPCFFVMFWLEQLFDLYLGIDYKSAFKHLSAVSDLLRLCFVNYKCKYKAEHECEELPKFNYDAIGDNNGSGITPIGHKITGIGASEGYGIWWNITGGYGEGWDCTHRNVNSDPYDAYTRDAVLIQIASSGDDYFDFNGANKAYATAENFPDTDAMDIIEALEHAFGFMFMYDENTNSIDAVFYKDILSSDTVVDLSYENGESDIVISDIYKKENHITGFRLRYSNSSSSSTNALTDQEELVKGSEDTTYNYNDYRKVSLIQGTGGVQYCKLIQNLGSYDETFYLSEKTGNGYRIKVDSDAKSESEWYPSLFEVGGYRDVEYGDCSEDDYVETVEIGFTPFIHNDINAENEKKMSSDSEVITGYTETTGGKGGEASVTTTTDTYPIIAAFCGDVEMHQPDSQGQVAFGKYFSQDWISAVIAAFGERGTIVGKPFYELGSNSNYTKEFGSGKVQFNYNFQLPQGYSDGDENGNPFNAVDSGFTLAFLRGGNTMSAGTATGDFNYFDPGYAGIAGQSKWTANVQLAAGADKGVITSDNYDQYGQCYGDLSLKLKAEKPRENRFNVPDERPFKEVDKSEYDTAEIDDRTFVFGSDGKTHYYVTDYDEGNPLYYPIESTYANRGLYDKFYVEYAYFITHRKIAVMTIPRGSMKVSTLKNLDFIKKYKIGEYIGWINKYSYSIDKDGVGDITIELYYL